MSTERNIVTQTGTSPILIWETDDANRCTYFNEAFRDFASMDLMEMLGDQWLTIVHPDDVAQLRESSHRAFEARLPFTLEARFRRHDGQYRWFLNVGSPRHLPDGTFIGYAGSNFDISESKQVLQTREEEQVRLRSILEHTPALIALVDLDFNYVYVNENYAAYRHSTPEALTGKNISEFLNDQQYHRVLDIFRQVAGGETVDFEATSDDDPRVLLVKCAPNFDSSRLVCGYNVFASDVTELRERKRHTELILNNLPARVAYLNVDTRVQWANQGFCKNVDLPLNQLIGRKLLQLIGEESFEIAEPYLRRALEGETVFHENTFRKDDGFQNVVVYFVPELSSNGITRGVFSLALDISPLKQAEAKLRRSDRRFELALQGPQVGFWETHPDHLAENDNWLLTENIEKLLGLPAGKLANSSDEFVRRVHPDDTRLVLDFKQQYTSRSGTHVAEFRLLTAADQYRWFRSVAESEIDKEGGLARAAGTIANINELKDAELKAAQQVRDRDVFLSMLSHELRNPLSAIRFAVDYCNNSGTTDAEYDSMLDIIGRQIDQMSRMLVDLLDVTRISSNRLTFEKENVDLSVLLDQTVESAVHKFQNKNQSLATDIPDGLPVFGDPVRLSQAFTNLLDNASKYTQNEGTVRLTASRISSRVQASGIGPQSSQQPGAEPVDTIDELLIVIEDNGCGISKNHLQNVFGLFYQEGRSARGAPTGLGLGLFLVNEIVEAHSGTIVATSKGPDCGSRFEVRLPCGSTAIDRNSTSARSSKRNKLPIADITSGRDD